MLLETQKFEFDDFLLDAAEKVLSRAGRPLPVTPKAFELLRVLLENHGHLVEKDALMKAVWADSFVEEANLAFTVGLIRKALGDKAQNPRFIETVPKRGYRFIAEVREVRNGERLRRPAEESTAPLISEVSAMPPAAPLAFETENPNPAPVAAPADRRSENKRQKPEERGAFAAQTNRGRLALGTFIVFVSALVALGYYFLAHEKAVKSDNKSIAVLPLKPIDKSVRDELYEIGIADSLIHRLGSIKGLTVRPLSAMRRYADLEQDPVAAGREQRTDFVLASNYQLAGGKIRVTAQLFNVPDGRLAATYQLEKDAGNVFAMQDAVADEIGKMLLARFAGTESRPRAKRGTFNEEAYRLYLQGM